MSNKLRYCVLCKRYDGRAKRSSYTRIYTVEREAKVREGYRRRYNGQEFDQPLLKQLVHQKCYNKIVQCLPSNDELIPSNDISVSIEQHQDDNDEEEENQTSLVQSRSCASIPSNIKKFLERSQRVCIVCNSYKYTINNRIKQVVSNFMANKLAEGFLYRYKRPYGKSLLDAYIHDSCYRKLYASYRYHPSRRCRNKNPLQYQQQYINQSIESPHETRSRSNLNKPSLKSKEFITEITADEPSNLSIDQLFSTSFSMSVATSNPNIELSARSCLFRPCIQRLTPEEIEFYTKKNSISKKINEDNTLISDQVPVLQSSIIQTPITNDLMIYSNQDNEVNTNEQDTSISHSTFNKQQKIRTAAEIRHRYSKPPPLAKPTNPLIYDHIYTPNTHSQKTPDDLEELYDWLIKELTSSNNPISMSEVLTKYRELTEEDISTTTTRENLCRVRLRNRLEKFYPNQFVFVVPNKRDGTYIAINNIEHYVRCAIKNGQQEKEKATEASILSSIIIPPTPKDYKRETCETIMNGIRKIRLYIRDPKQTNTSPSLLMQNIISLITTSEKQFDKISHEYDFYRMIDENLFDNGNQIKTKKFDKNIRNMSLASDLISARHDNQISQKHFLLADELTKETFRCTPKQVITLLNRYGHTCSYKSYRKIKKLRQKMINELGENFITDEEKSSDSELDLMEL